MCFPWKIPIHFFRQNPQTAQVAWFLKGIRHTHCQGVTVNRAPVWWMDFLDQHDFFLISEQWKKGAPGCGCSGYLLGMEFYTQLCGDYSKSWDKDPVIKQPHGPSVTPNSGWRLVMIVFSPWKTNKYYFYPVGHVVRAPYWCRCFFTNQKVIFKLVFPFWKVGTS